MKFIKLFSVFTVMMLISTLNAQDKVVNAQEMVSIFNSAHASTNASFGANVFFVNPKSIIDGTVYLFDNWENYAVIHTINHQKFSLLNINLNIQRNTFDSKVGKDSLFSFSFKNIEKFVINNRVFKNYYWDDKNKVYEVISEGNDFEILKGFTVTFKEGNPNPMLNRKNDKFVRGQIYYIRKNDKIASINLNKSSVLKLLDLDEQQKQKVMTYTEERKLSFKKEEDLKNIIDFVNKLK